jgi:hypothetical protein
MSKEKVNVKVEVDDETGDVNITLTDEKKSRIPRPGDSIYIVEPYPVDDDDEDAVETYGDVKEKPILAYSYTGLLAKAVVLSDDLDSVKINGDFEIPLTKRMIESSKKQLIFTNEDEARDKYKTLMTISIKEATRRLRKAENIKEYLETALEKMHH